MSPPSTRCISATQSMPRSSQPAQRTVLPTPLPTTPFDLRTDIPRYKIYSAGKFIRAGELSPSLSEAGLMPHPHRSPPQPRRACSWRAHRWSRCGRTRRREGRRGRAGDYPATMHGEPIAWGLADLARPDFGDPISATPQNAIVRRRGVHGTYDCVHIYKQISPSIGSCRSLLIAVIAHEY